MCSVIRGSAKRRTRAVALGISVFVGTCHVTMVAYGQSATTTPKAIAPGTPPTNPSAQSTANPIATAYSLGSTTMTINYWMAAPTIGGLVLIQAGAASAPVNIVWDSPTGDPPPVASVKVVFSVTFNGLPAKDYVVSPKADLVDSQYPIPPDDMKAFIAALIGDINRNLVQPFNPNTVIALDGPVQVKVTRYVPPPPATKPVAANPSGGAAAVPGTPSPKSKITSNNLTISFQRVLGP
jgi:hypothetical protein